MKYITRPTVILCLISTALCALAQTRTVSGKIELSGFNDFHLPQLFLEAWQPGTDNLISVMQIFPDVDGHYTAVVPSTADLSIKPNGWLRQVRANERIAANPSQVNFQLTSGDTNRDNQIDDFDLANVIFGFAQRDSRVDVTGDGIIDDFDLASVIFNFLQAGDRSVPPSPTAAYTIRLKNNFTDAPVPNAQVFLVISNTVGDQFVPFTSNGDGSYSIVSSAPIRVGWSVIAPNTYYPQTIRYNSLVYQTPPATPYDKNQFAILPIPPAGAQIDLGTAYLYDANDFPPFPNRP